jgi:proteasome assembly chaperone (PAC2) family protein
MAIDYVELGEVPSLRSPVLITAFGGWNDAAQAATSALRFLAKQWSARQFASIDPEEFFDFTSTRPTVRLNADAQRELEWPSNAFLYHTDPALERDVVMLLGVEPHLKWRAFSAAVMGVARECGISLVASMGALLADAAHTRPVPLSGFATAPGIQERLQRLGLTGSRYEGPTGIIGVIHDACRRGELPSMSLWAAVPHYLGPTPNPKASAAVLRTLDDLLGLRLKLAELEEAADSFEEQVNEAIAGSPEVAEYVRTLEQRADSALEAETTAAEGADLPPSEALIKELEDFLKRSREEGGDA